MSHQSTRGTGNSHVASTSPIGVRTVHVRCPIWPRTIRRAHLPTQMSTGMCFATVLPPLEQPYLSLGYTASSTNQHRHYFYKSDANNDCEMHWVTSYMFRQCWIPKRWEYHIFQTNGNNTMSSRMGNRESETSPPQTST